MKDEGMTKVCRNLGRPPRSTRVKVKKKRGLMWPESAPDLECLDPSMKWITETLDVINLILHQGLAARSNFGSDEEQIRHKAAARMLKAATSVLQDSPDFITWQFVRLMEIRVKALKKLLRKTVPPKMRRKV